MVLNGSIPRTRYALLILTITVWIVYGNTLLNGFVWDDNNLVVGNPAYSRFDIKLIFTTLANGLEFLPVRDVSYAVDYLLWGESPAGFHFSNVAYYWLTVIAVFFLARSTSFCLRRDREDRERFSFRAGLSTALLFAVHPLHSEVVSFITCRNAIISTLLFFCACQLFLRFSHVPSGGILPLAGALFCYSASLLAKVTSIILPLVLVCYALYPSVAKRMRSFCAIIPFAGLAAGAFFFFREIALRAYVIHAQQGITAIGGWQIKIIKPLRIAAFYICKLVIPFGYASEYDMLTFYAPPSLGDVAIVVAVALAGGAAYLLRRNYPYFLFCYGWYFVTLIPVLNFFPTAPIVADRYAFLPSFGFMFLLASVMTELAGQEGRLRLAGATLAVVSVWGGLAFQANRVWYSEETLWKNAISVTPGAVNSYSSLGRIYFFANPDDGRAFSYFAKAQENNVGDPNLDYFNGLRFYLKGDLPAAIPHFNKALGRSIDFIEALYHLGLIYEQMGDREKAVEYFRLAIDSQQMESGESFKAKAAERLRALSP